VSPPTPVVPPVSPPTPVVPPVSPPTPVVPPVSPPTPVVPPVSPPTPVVPPVSPPVTPSCTCDPFGGCSNPITEPCCSSCGCICTGPGGDCVGC
jgi:hypothetical protein